MRIYGVIPAGGSGTRLWPVSRSAKPKFLMPLPGPGSMLQETLDRLRPIIDPGDVYILTGHAHAVDVSRQLPDVPTDNIVVEPAARGTGPAIGFGAALIARRDPDAIMGSFAADHYVADAEGFRRAVLVAARAAQQGYLVTLGVEPTHPHTGYGYIHRAGKIAEDDGFTVYEVESFKEKPDLPTAERFFNSGEYSWNASMFIWSVRSLLEAMRDLLPDVYETLQEIAEAWDTPDREAVMERLWPSIRNVTIDHGIMEHAGKVAVVPVDFGWADVGGWDNVAALLAKTEEENMVIGARHLEQDTRSTLIIGHGRTVATVGVENLVIVDTEDALLVCSREKAQDVKFIVERLKAEGDSDLT